MDHLAREANPGAAAHLDRECALFDAAETGAGRETVLTWEVSQPTVVVGRGGRVEADVLEDACRRDGVPVLRRTTGGGAVVLGPGCLNYALILSFVSRPALVDVAHSFRFVLERVAAALGVPGVAIEGRTDLALAGRKVSGSAQRRGRTTVLHHGTLLYDFGPALAVRYLKEPARQPAWRAKRHHADFLGNLPLDGATIGRRLHTHPSLADCEAL